MFQQFMSGMMPMPGSMPGAGPTSEPDVDTMWKSKLHQQCQTAGIAEKFEYTVSEAPGGYVAAVTFQGQTFASDEVKVNKKAATQMAAKEALRQCFPDAFDACASGGAVQKPSKGQKRKNAEEAAAEMHPKALLNQGMEHLIRKQFDRAKAKEDIVYTVTEIEGEVKSYQCQVTIPSQAGKSWVGDACTSKKEAEQSAAHTAYMALTSVFAPLIAEHQAMKKAKYALELEKLKEKQAAKKAAAKQASAIGL